MASPARWTSQQTSGGRAVVRVRSRPSKDGKPICRAHSWLRQTGARGVRVKRSGRQAPCRRLLCRCQGICVLSHKTSARHELQCETARALSGVQRRRISTIWLPSVRARLGATTRHRWASCDHGSLCCRIAGLEIDNARRAPLGADCCIVS